MTPVAPCLFDVLHGYVEGMDDFLDGFRGPAWPVLGLQAQQHVDKTLFRRPQDVHVETMPRDSRTKGVSNTTDGGVTSGRTNASNGKTWGDVSRVSSSFIGIKNAISGSLARPTCLPREYLASGGIPASRRPGHVNWRVFFSGQASEVTPIRGRLASTWDTKHQCAGSQETASSLGSTFISGAGFETKAPQAKKIRVHAIRARPFRYGKACDSKATTHDHRCVVMSPIPGRRQNHCQRNQASREVRVLCVGFIGSKKT